MEVSAVESKTNYIERYWRDATPADAIKEPPMVARFKDHGYEEWVVGKLIIWDRSESPWCRDGDHYYDRCQVYDAPDPGEGWRLIDVENETPEDGDEVWGGVGQWFSRGDSFRIFRANNHYRRRIEQPKPKYVPFEWEDREQLRGRLITFVDRNRTVEFRCESFSVDGDGFLVNDTYAYWLCKNAVFVDTGEPVGKRVS